MITYTNIIEKLPKRLVEKSKNEYVCWTAFNEKGKEFGKKDYEACYSPIMSQLGTFEIHNFPYLKKRTYSDRLHPISYLQYMKFCKREGLIPPEVKVFVDAKEGNCMIVPRLGWSRHTVYVTLSMYRFADVCPKSILAALHIYRKTKLPWLQVLHYVLTKINIGSGHTFIAINSGLYSRKYNQDPRVGMALKAFCSLPEKDRISLEPIGDTKTMFSNMLAEIKAVREFSTLEEILNPKYSRLYIDSSLGEEDLYRIMNTK